jgi:7,8-dihydropterin-6-yl-methyl-4-(beta-D-ribofuranosyl)aminobenzene 5'-phosphate synthase
MDYTKKLTEDLYNPRNIGEIPDSRNSITITTLVDNTASENLASEHGLSFWIEYNNKHILFDTGQSDIILKNSELLGINLAETDAIVISHGHYDHTGGLATVLEVAPKAPVYVHPAAFNLKFSRKNNTNKAIGISDSTKQRILEKADNGEVIWTEGPAQVTEGLFITGQIPRITDFEDVPASFFIDKNCQKTDTLPDDQAMFLDSPKGIVVILGCAHAGVVNTLDYVAKLSGQDHIFAVIGGMHLLSASAERIKHTVDTFRRYNIQRIGPAHCTGNNTIEKFKEAFAERCFICSAGKRIHL